MSKLIKTNYTARKTLNAKIKNYPTERKNFKPKDSCTVYEYSIRTVYAKKISSMAEHLLYFCGRISLAKNVCIRKTTSSPC